MMLSQLYPSTTISISLRFITLIVIRLSLLYLAVKLLPLPLLGKGESMELLTQKVHTIQSGISLTISSTASILSSKPRIS